MNDSELTKGPAARTAADVEAVRPRGARRGLFMVTAVSMTVVITLLCLEVVVRIMNPPIQVGPALVQFSETLGFELKPNLQCRRRSREYDTTICSNSMGMRGPEVGEEKGRRVVRILCIGDSFTFGRGVNDEESFVRLIERRLNAIPDGVRYEVLNGGVVGWGTGNELMFLRQRGLQLQPDMILLQLYANDFDDNMRSTLFTVDRDGRLHEGRAYSGLKTITGIFNALPGKSILENSYLFNYARTFLNISVRPGGGGNDEASEAAIRERERAAEVLTSALLSAVVGVARDAGVPMVATTIDLSEKQRRVVSDVFAAASVPILSLDGMKKEHPELYFKYDFHWNRAGHAWAANQLAEFLLEHLGDPRHSTPSALGKSE